MLLLNRTLLHMAKGLWGWIFVITGLKLAVLAGTAGYLIRLEYRHERRKKTV